MASIYDQSLDEVASQVKVLADAINTSLLPGKEIPIQRLDPESDYESQFQHLVAIAFTERSESPRGFSNETDIWGYPCHVVFGLPKRENRDRRHGEIQELFEMIPSHFAYQHRMSAVNSTLLGCSMPCTVQAGPNITTKRKIFRTQTIWCWYEHIRQS